MPELHDAPQGEGRGLEKAPPALRSQYVWYHFLKKKKHETPAVFICSGIHQAVCSRPPPETLPPSQAIGWSERQPSPRAQPACHLLQEASPISCPESPCLPSEAPCSTGQSHSDHRVGELLKSAWGWRGIGQGQRLQCLGSWEGVLETLGPAGMSSVSSLRGGVLVPVKGEKAQNQPPAPVIS